jgi:hypothetical protein
MLNAFACVAATLSLAIACITFALVARTHDRKTWLTFTTREWFLLIVALTLGLAWFLDVAAHHLAVHHNG